MRVQPKSGMVTILRGGTILTMDGGRPSDVATRALGRPDVPDAAGRRATALAFAGDRIVAVGSDAEVLPLAGRGARVVDLQGRCLLPGFQDPHAHPLGEGLQAGRPSLAGTESRAAALRRLAELASRLAPGEWLEGRYDPTGWPDGRHPTRAELDEAVPERPVLLMHASGHAAVASSLALALAGIGPAAADRPGRAEIERDEHGVPTGLVAGSDPATAFAAVLPPLTAELARAALVTAAGRLARDGVTAVGDADLGVVATPIDELAAYAGAILDEAFPPRLSVLPGLARLAGADEDPPTPDDLRDLLPRDLRERIRIVAAKLYADGALTTRDAWLLAPYADAPGTAGRPTHPPVELAERIRRAHLAGWQLATHAIGDAAVAATLDAYAAALAAAPRQDHRHRLEHAMLLSPSAVARLAALGVAAVLQPEFTAWAGDTYLARLGEARAARLLPYAELLAARAAVAFSSDRPVTRGAPLDGMRALFRGAGPSGRQLAPASSRPSAAEAVHAWTAGAAHVAFDEAESGRLTPARRADLVVLTTDPTRVAPGAWADGSDGVAVVATVIDGQEVAGDLG